MSEAQDIVVNLQERLCPLFSGYKFEIRRLHQNGPQDGIAIDFYRLETDANLEAVQNAEAFLKIAIDAYEPVTAKWLLDGSAPRLKVRSLKSANIRFPSKEGTPLEILNYVTKWFEHHVGYLKSGIPPKAPLKAVQKAREEPLGPRGPSGPRRPRKPSTGTRTGGNGGGGRKVFSPFKKKKGIFDW